MLTRGWLFRPTRIDRYILSELAGPFWGSIAFLVFLALMFQTLRWAELLIVHGVPFWVILKMAGLITLTFLPMALPFGFLITVLVAFGRLSADSEITAMKACGVGLLRILLPASWVGASVAIASLMLNLHWAPWAERGLRDIIYRVSNTKVSSAIREGTFTTGFFDLLVFADKVDSKTGRLSRVFLYDEREPANPFVVTAQQGEVLSLKTDKELETRAVLRLTNGSLHRSDPSTSSYERMDYSVYQNYLNIPEGTGFTDWRSGILSQGDLLKQIAEETDWQKMRELRSEYWRRYQFALSPFVFLIIGVAFGTLHIRTARSSAALVTVLVLLPYWVVLAIGSSWAHTGVVPPWLGLCLANVMTLIIGIFALRRTALN